ncbi:YdcF family protein [Endothiovibrio diazotrophicus]
MNVETTRIIELVLLPPAGPLLLTLIGAVLLWARRRSGYLLVAVGWVTLYFASLPFTAFALAQFLEATPPLDDRAIAESRAQAIVVLGAGRYPSAPGYGGVDTANAAELERLRYAAWLQRRSGLPIAVIGGDPLGTGTSEAAFMQRILSDEFHAEVKWADGRSRHTFDNARFAWERLEAAGITRILLVSHVWHLPRAAAAFEARGFTVTPAPTAYLHPGALTRGPLLWLPAAWALEQNRRYLHELIGTLWYRYFR